MINEELGMRNGRNKLTEFFRGFLSGFIIALILFGAVAYVYYQRTKDREIIKYVELQQNIETMREDINNLSADELLDVPGVRGAVDEANAEFDRKRDEALLRFRSGLAGR